MRIYSIYNLGIEVSSKGAVVEKLMKIQPNERGDNE